MSQTASDINRTVTCCSIPDISRTIVVTGTISASNQPSLWALAALRKEMQRYKTSQIIQEAVVRKSEKQRYLLISN